MWRADHVVCTLHTRRQLTSLIAAGTLMLNLLTHHLLCLTGDKCRQERAESSPVQKNKKNV